MLEQENKNEQDRRERLKYDENLVFKYKIRIMLLDMMIKKYGLQTFMEQEEPVLDEEDKVLNIPLDEKSEIYKFMKKNPHYNEVQLAKELFRESEYYPR